MRTTQNKCLSTVLMNRTDFRLFGRGSEKAGR